MTIKEKQTVHFTDPVRIELGKRAVVTPLDHPSPLVSNDRPVSTSPVQHISYTKSGDVLEFETANTIYVKE